MSKPFQALIFSMATAFTGVATAGGTQTWGHVSDALAIGLPLVAAGKAFGTGDSEGVKEPTYSLGPPLIPAQTLKAPIHQYKPYGSGNHRYVHLSIRRQSQMCIRNSILRRRIHRKLMQTVSKWLARGRSSNQSMPPPPPNINGK